MDEETIVSLATPVGRAGVAIIRVSGNKTSKILKGIIKVDNLKLKPREAKYCHFTNGRNIIDDGLVTFFKAPNSYTGEDVAELSIHSNPFLIEELVGTISSLGARQAMAGEFTYRAFKNGKIDLIQAESINELINSNTRLNLQMKFNNLEGKLSSTINSIKKSIIKLGIINESSIEFGEDNYLEEQPIIQELDKINNYLNKVLSLSRFNEILDKGFKIVLAGKVNVGKSSIFNNMVMENRSIVSSEPGTTRDYIEKKIYLNGFTFEITDIAGFNDKTSGVIEDEGIRRSVDKVKNCDAVIFILDASEKPDSRDMAIYDLIKDKKHLIIANKEDISDSLKLDVLKQKFPTENINSISVKENKNTKLIIDYLISLTEKIEDLNIEVSVNHRQKLILSKLVKVIESIIVYRKNTSDAELLAEDIRNALNLIGQLTGEVSSEDILNGIFSTFCIGK